MKALILPSLLIFTNCLFAQLNLEIKRSKVLDSVDSLYYQIDLEFQNTSNKKLLLFLYNPVQFLPHGLSFKDEEVMGFDYQIFRNKELQECNYVIRTGKSKYQLFFETKYKKRKNFHLVLRPFEKKEYKNVLVKFYQMNCSSKIDRFDLQVSFTQNYEIAKKYRRLNEIKSSASLFKGTVISNRIPLNFKFDETVDDSRGTDIDTTKRKRYRRQRKK